MLATNIIWPPVEDGDELAATRKRILALISILTGTLGILSATISGFETFAAAPFVTIFGVVAPLVFLSLPFVAYASRRQKLTAFLMLALLYADMVIMALGSNGLMSTAVFYLVALPILATLLISNRAGIFLCAVAIVTYIAITPAVLEFWVSFTLSILCVGLTAVVATFQREMDRVTQHLSDARRSAEAGHQAKTEFLANLSHEMRTPLNGVIGMAQLLTRTELGTAQAKYADTILTSGNSLLSLINDVLDLSRINANEMTVHVEEFDLSSLANEVADTVRAIAIQKDLDVIVNVASDVAGKYLGDRKKIGQILVNFAGNAIKFTDYGCVEISAVQCNTGNVRFHVTDTGPGIEEDQLKLVFERFKQADNSSTRKHGGTGLGLAISHKLACLLGGQVGACSTKGEGSTFWLDLPLNKIDSPPSKTRNAQDACISSFPDRALRILVADDNIVNREVIKAALSRQNVTVHEVENGSDVIEALSLGEAFDLVLMDVQMPVMSGDDALCRIRNSGKEYAATPVVMVSANDDTTSADIYLAMGADGYLAKPFNISDLYGQISKLSLVKNLPRDISSNERVNGSK